MENKLLTFIDFDLEKYKKGLEDKIKTENLQTLKNHLEEQLEWINKAIENNDVANQIITKWFPQALDIYIADKGKFDAFKDDTYVEDKNNFIHKMYSHVEKMFPELTADELTSRYSFVTELSLKLYFRYEEQFRYKYIVLADDEIPSDDDGEEDEEDE